MSAAQSFTPAQLARFAELCEMCAQHIPAEKNDAGEYVHAGVMKCSATRLRNLFEQPEITLEERAWGVWIGEQCGHCKTHKKPRQWFCYPCWKLLPAELQNKLKYGKFRQQHPWFGPALAVLQKRTNGG